MTNTKSTKRALLVSVMAMVICFTMLLGTTFAWFTSEAQVADNVITAGNLEVSISNNAINLTDVEPGYVHVHKFTIGNEGSLSFNYQLKLALADGDNLGKLAEVIEVYYFLNDVTPNRANLTGTSADGYLGTLKEVVESGKIFGQHYIDAEGDDVVVTFAFKMQETAGNEYQSKGLDDGFIVQVYATQRVEEEDSLGGGYDNHRDDTTPGDPLPNP